MICVICNEFFVPRKNSRQVCCDKKSCRAARKKQMRAKLEGKPLNALGPRPCEVCGATFKPFQPNQKTCSNHYCKREMKKRTAALRAIAEKAKPKPERVKVCPECGAKYTPRNILTPTCGKQKCVKSYRSKQNKKYQSRHLLANAEKIQSEIVAKKRAKWMEERERILSQIVCPWSAGYMTDLPFGVTSWSDPIMDPLSGGFPMRTFSVPNVAREVAA